MATHSNYVDAMLATPMKESKGCYEISFPDIAPSTWESMLRYLEGPMEARLMTVEDTMEVAPLYDKYDFGNGCRLCDQVLLKEYFQDNKKILSNLDCIVDAVLLADAANLIEAKNVGVAWLYKTFHFSTDDPTDGGIIFTENQIRKLVPLLIKEDNLYLIVESIFHGSDVNGGSGIKSKEDLRSPLFPWALVMAYKSFGTRIVLAEEIARIKLSGTGCNADGICTNSYSYGHVYECNRRGRWAGVQVHFKVVLVEDVDQGGWSIVGEEIDGDSNEVLEIDEDGDEAFKLLWRCHNSQNLPLPPQDGWIPVDELARGQPTVSYRVDDDE
jgi:hypothetical protein